MPADGGTIALDWEIPLPEYASSLTPRKSRDDIQKDISKGPIDQPVVIILHGINNHAGFGYMKSLMQTFSTWDGMPAA